MNARIDSAREPAGPWYREPWPWLIMIAPAAAVIGGVVMLWLAIDSYDGLVSDDYYRQGLAINQLLSRDQRAAELGYRAHASLAEDGSLARVRLSTAETAVSPSTLQLRLAHPTRAGLDQIAVLHHLGSGLYEGKLTPPTSGRWRVSIEDTAGSWRLAGTWSLPNERTVQLEPMPAAAAR